MWPPTVGSFVVCAAQDDKLRPCRYTLAVEDNEFDTAEPLTLTRNRIGRDRIQEMERIFGDLLDAVGEDRHRQGLERTPVRAARSFEFLTQGYRICVEDVVNGAIFDSDASEIVMV